jgi:arylsulfatase A-like enzyme
VIDDPAALAARRLVLRQVGAAAGELGTPRGSARALARSADLARAASERPWKLAFENDWRTGVAALPGQVTTWTPPDLRQGDVLESAIAGPRQLRFRWILEERDGETILAESAGPGGAGWRPLRHVLQRAPDCPCRLRFETAADDAGAWGGWAEPLLLRAGPPRPSLVLVSLDTVRRDRLAPYGGPAALTPFLARFATERAVVFDRALTASTWTLPSHLSMLSGLEAFEHGVFSETSSGAVPQPAWLPALLREAGYRTVAVTAGGFVHPSFGFANGFDEYLAVPFEDRPDQELTEVVDAALARLDRLARQPVFLFVHTYEAHVPNRRRPTSRLPPVAEGDALVVEGRTPAPDPGQGFVGRPGFTLRDAARDQSRPATESDAAILLDAYDRSIAHLDDQLGRLFAGAPRLAARADALVIVTSDHGEALGEHGRMSHAILDDANCRVPLLVDWPGSARPREHAGEPVSLTAVAPTILAAAGVPIPAPMRAAPLAAAGAESGAGGLWTYVASNNQGLALHLRDGRKLIVRDGAWRGTAGRARLVDPPRDPSEAQDLRAAEPEAERWYRVARRVLVDNLPGLRITLRNDASVPVEVELRHPAIHPGGTKLFAADLELEWIRPGRALARLAPGEIGDWILLDARGERVDLEGSVRIGSRPSAPFALHEARARAGLFATTGAGGTLRWSAATSENALVSLVLESRGSRATAPGPVPDRELERQLRALGYVE